MRNISATRPYGEADWPSRSFSDGLTRIADLRRKEGKPATKPQAKQPRHRLRSVIASRATTPASARGAYGTVDPPGSRGLLRLEETAEALTARGFKTAEKTLSTKATRGVGPPYRSYGRTPPYRWGDALAWAQSRLSEVRSSTSEAETQVVGRGVTPGKDPLSATSSSIAGSERRFEDAPQRRGKHFAAAIAAAKAHA